jgi:2-dehydro-3-deoxyphosphooctonate aldolase (KDO 8-P synthase)
VAAGFVVDGPAGPLQIGDGSLRFILGPCLLESEEHALRLGSAIDAQLRARGARWIFKASFDKANRSSPAGARGPGVDRGLEILARVRATLGVPVTTDVHLPDQVAAVAEVVDLVQVPAFLCRQTDLLAAVGACGKPAHLKKGQFVAPGAMAGALAKVRASGGGGVLITERGSAFGHHDLVVDMRGLVELRALGAAVGMDATHAAQRPGALGDRSGGQRWAVPALARAAVAVGVDVLFAEVHEDPDRAPSDGPVMVPLGALGGLIDQVLAIHAAVNGAPVVDLGTPGAP